MLKLKHQTSKKFHVCSCLLQVTPSDTPSPHLPSEVLILFPLAVGVLSGPSNLKSTTWHHEGPTWRR